MTAAVTFTAARRRRGRAALFVVLIAAVLYGGAVGYLMLHETRLIFKTDLARNETRPAFPYERVDIPRADRLPQFAWKMAADGGGAHAAADLWVLYLQSNASTIASRMNVAHYARLRA